jgi:transposase
MTPDNAAKRSIASVARRWRALDDEARSLQRHSKAILDELARPLLAVHGVGYDTATQLLITAGDNPHRLRHERSYASLCGASPTPDPSGRTNGRLRLNRGGDRHANSALWRIVIVPMATRPETKRYVERRTKEGMPTVEIIRCLNRYVARELFPPSKPSAPHHQQQQPLDNKRRSPMRSRLFTRVPLRTDEGTPGP